MAYAIAAVLAAANLPTPLYPHYQRVDHLSTATLTVVFVAYVVTVAATLTVAGQASDPFRRRALLLPAPRARVLSRPRSATPAAFASPTLAVTASPSDRAHSSAVDRRARASSSSLSTSEAM